MFTLTLVTPEKRLVFGKDVEEVFVPAYRGELHVLPGHAPLMTTLSTGVLRYRLKGEDKVNIVAISWGYCQVNPKGINILAETAETAEDMDMDRLKLALTNAESKLAQTDLDVEMMNKYLQKASRARTRLEVAGLATEKNQTTH